MNRFVDSRPTRPAVCRIALGLVFSLGLVMGCTTGAGTTQEPVSRDPGASTSSPMPVDWGPLAVGL